MTTGDAVAGSIVIPPEVAQRINRLLSSEPEEVICPACTECSIFTIILIKEAPDAGQNGAWAKCQNCGHLIEIRLVGRYATANAAGEVEVP